MSYWMSAELLTARETLANRRYLSVHSLLSKKLKEKKESDWKEIKRFFYFDDIPFGKYLFYS